MRKLPEGEAKRRHDERNKIQNERLKEERRQSRIAKGLPEVSTPEWRKEQMRIYMKQRRTKEREANADIIAACKEAKAIIKAEKEKSALVKSLKKAKDKRIQARLNGKPDLRTKAYQPVKPFRAPVPMPAPKAPKSKPVKLKPNQLQNRVIDLNTLVPVKVDDKTTIYVKPGQNIDQVKQRYIAHKLKL